MEKICKQCGRKLLVKQTKRTAAQLKKPYYYTAYYYCFHCKKLYHDEKFKVENPQTTSLFADARPESNPPFKEVGKSTYDVEIWTDGACVNNGKPSARAAWAFVSGETERRGLVTGKQTNNVAEALAIYHGLKWAGEKGHKTVNLHTDSQISLYNMKKSPERIVANKEIFADIFTIIKKHALQVSFVKVLGHSGDVQNDRVDKLANTLAAEAK